MPAFFSQSDSCPGRLKLELAIFSDAYPSRHLADALTAQFDAFRLNVQVQNLSSSNTSARRSSILVSIQTFKFSSNTEYVFERSCELCCRAQMLQLCH